MGSWGSGNFDNDTALDWVTGFLEKPGTGTVRKLLLSGQKIKDGPDWDEPLAAAETVALLRGHPAEDCPRELQTWARLAQKAPGIELQQLAQKTIHHALKISHTKENLSLWLKPINHAQWIKTQQGLLQRLSAPYFKLPELAVEENDPEEDTGPRYIITGHDPIDEEKGSISNLIHDGKWIKVEALPAKLSAQPKPGAPFTIQISLDDYFTTDELTKLSQWLSRHGRHRIVLSQNAAGDFISRKEGDQFLRAAAPGLEYLQISFDKCSYETLVAAKNLKKLCLSCNRRLASSKFNFLTKLKSLEVLKLAWPVHFTKNTPLSQLRHLKSLNISVDKLESNCLPELPVSLEELTLRIQSSNATTDLSAIGKLKNLRYLNLRISQSIPLQPALRELVWLKIYGGYFLGGNKWSDLSFLRGSPRLRHLELEKMTALKDISVMHHLPHLERLHLNGLDQLRDLSTLEALPKLETLQLMRLGRIKQLPELPKLKRLQIGVPQQIEKGDGMKQTQLKEWNLQGKRDDLELAAELRREFPATKYVQNVDHWPFPHIRRFANYFH